MTTNLLRVGATVLFFTASCKGDFAAGTTDNGDASAQEAGARQDGADPNAQEAAPQSSTGSVSCDPFQPAAKPITLTNVIGVGQDTDGTLYVVDQPQPGGERVFVSSGGTLQRQRGAGSGTESSGNGVVSYDFTITDHTPPFMLRLETDASGPTAMGVLQNPPMDIKSFTIGQQGGVLTLVPASQVAALPVANIPAQTFIEYNATLADGRALLVVRPRDDWTYQDFRVFFGAPAHMAERSVDQVVRYTDGGSTTINFTIDGAAAVASFPVQLSPGGLVIGPATLTIGTTSFPLTLGPTDSAPAGESYFCFGNPSVDGGVDAWGAPADGKAGTSCEPGATLIGASYDLSKSRFAFGSTPVREDASDMTRWVGSDGVVAIWSCGAEGGSMNSGAPETDLPDWSSDSSALSDHVRAYLISMGVEPCQIADTQVQAGTDGYSISLVRGVDGIAVGESIAYAKFNVNDQTTSEGLYWPTIPAETVASARAFRDLVADPVALAAYKAKLPATAQGNGEVIIHHSHCPSLSTSSTFQSGATYDVGDGSPWSGSVSFDINGNPVSTALW